MNCKHCARTREAHMSDEFLRCPDGRHVFTPKPPKNHAKEVLRKLWIRVLEMEKDARTDYKLPPLADCDLRAIVELQPEVAEVLK